MNKEFENVVLTFWGSIENMITLLLSTYNGEKYLQEQIDSFSSQSHKNFRLIARDDGSSDKSKEILVSNGIDLLSSDRNVGVKKSFSLLLEHALKETSSEYFMFGDQDDVWDEEKIGKTFKKMKEMENKYPNIALLVHTDLEVVDKNLQTIDKSFWHFENIDPSCNDFNRLLIQNTITGCTVMINRKLAELALPIPHEAIMHDWWLGLVASKFGKIAYIDEPLIKYRQHGNNSIGAKGFGYWAIWTKFYKIFVKNEFYLHHLLVNIFQAKAFLERYRDILDAKTIEILKDFTSIESKSFLQKRKTLLRYKLFKQGFTRNLGLFLKI